MSTGTYRKSKVSDAKKAELREQRVAELKQLRDSLAAFEESADPAFIAATLAVFDGYSPRNAMLIAMQRPDATDVAGFREWKERGRFVRKGEHGIRIMAPAGTYQVKEEGKPEAPEGDSDAHEFMRFRAVSVFDIAQTDPVSELPESAPVAYEDAELFAADLAEEQRGTVLV